MTRSNCFRSQGPGSGSITLPHCGGPVTATCAPGRRKQPSPQRYQGLHLTGLSAPAFPGGVIKTDGGWALGVHGHCFWRAHIPCPLGPEWLMRSQTSQSH